MPKVLKLTSYHSSVIQSLVEASMYLYMYILSIEIGVMLKSWRHQISSQTTGYQRAPISTHCYRHQSIAAHLTSNKLSTSYQGLTNMTFIKITDPNHVVCYTSTRMSGSIIAILWFTIWRIANINLSQSHT